MKKKPYYLNCYKKWLSVGSMPDEGLCICFAHDDLTHSEVKQFEPNDSDLKQYKIRRKSGGTYWGSDSSSDPRYHEFTPLRQTIVLFLAAMNNEL